MRADFGVASDPGASYASCTRQSSQRRRPTAFSRIQLPPTIISARVGAGDSSACGNDLAARSGRSAPRSQSCSRSASGVNSADPLLSLDSQCAAGTYAVHSDVASVRRSDAHGTSLRTPRVFRTGVRGPFPFGTNALRPRSAGTCILGPLVCGSIGCATWIFKCGAGNAGVRYAFARGAGPYGFRTSRTCVSGRHFSVNLVFTSHAFATIAPACLADGHEY